MVGCRKILLGRLFVCSWSLCNRLCTRFVFLVLVFFCYTHWKSFFFHKCDRTHIHMTTHLKNQNERAGVSYFLFWTGKLALNLSNWSHHTHSHTHTAERVLAHTQITHAHGTAETQNQNRTHVAKVRTIFASSSCSLFFELNGSKKIARDDDGVDVISLLSLCYVFSAAQSALLIYFNSTNEFFFFLPLLLYRFGFY